MSDTWVYDCSSRRWELRFPEAAPSPRAGHAMLYLAKSGRTALLGGYGYGSGGRDLELWSYATAEDRWELIGKWSATGESAGEGEDGDLPRSPASAVLESVAGPEDTILCGDWVLRAVAGAGGGVANAVRPGAISRRGGSADPDWWDDGLPAPDAAGAANRLGSVPANTWVGIRPPRTLSSNRDHATAALDVDRGQILYFGGGRSAYSGTDVHLYSIRANRWRTSSWADLPVGFDGNTGHHGQRWSFEGRPFISSHVFGMYAYDPRAQRMILHNRGDTFTFDPATGEWTRLEIDTPFTGGWTPKLCATPRGVIAWSSEKTGNRVRPGGLWRFDATSKSWRRVKTAGEKPPAVPGDDYGGLAYDPERDRLLMFAAARGGGFRGAWGCSLGDGRIGRVAISNPSAGPGTPREAVCLPGGRYVLFAGTRKGANLVLDLEAGAFRLLGAGSPPRVSPTSCGLLRDDRRGLVWLLSGAHGWPLYVLRFDAKTAKFSKTK